MRGSRSDGFRLSRICSSFGNIYDDVIKQSSLSEPNLTAFQGKFRPLPRHRVRRESLLFVRSLAYVDLGAGQFFFVVAVL